MSGSHTARFGVVILAGGRARRFPGKLQAELAGRSLLQRVVDNFAGSATIVASVDAAFDREQATKLRVDRIVVDESPERGPLGGLVSTLPTILSELVFVAAGDAPFVDASLAAMLAAHLAPDIDAVVPRHGMAFALRVEPLAALYARDALLIAARAELDCGNGSLLGVLARLRVRYVDAEERYFANINTPADLARIRTQGDAPEPPSHDAR